MLIVSLLKTLRLKTCMVMYILMYICKSCGVLKIQFGSLSMAVFVYPTIFPS